MFWLFGDPNGALGGRDDACRHGVVRGRRRMRRIGMGSPVGVCGCV